MKPYGVPRMQGRRWGVGPNQDDISTDDRKRIRRKYKKSVRSEVRHILKVLPVNEEIDYETAICKAEQPT